MATTSESTSFRPYVPPASRLEPVSALDACKHRVVGKCKEPSCNAEHGVYLLEDEPTVAVLPRNVINLKARDIAHQGALFDNTPPSDQDAKHDNDHARVTNIKILPTTDEIICLKPAYMPEKDNEMDALSLLDAHFRHLRYDKTESIVDACYDAFQRAIWSSPSSRFNFETPRGVPYSLLGEVKFEACRYHRFDGAHYKLSYYCPAPLRQFALLQSNLFEAQKLCTLIAIHEDTSEVNVIHFEVKERTPTDPSSKTDPNRASIQVSLADKGDVSKVRQATYYARGLVKAKFFLVNLPSALPVSFMPALQRLQACYKEATFPFAEISAATSNGAEVSLLAPEYALKHGFKYDISSLKAEDSNATVQEMYFEPMKNGVADEATIARIKQHTTLDDGQAIALYENLSRRLAFTQGPPGTGKTFLGVAEAEVILKSQARSPSGKSAKPIIVICMTNHALDDFVESLISRGIKNVVRLGNRSTNEWMTEYLLKHVIAKHRQSMKDASIMKKDSDDNKAIEAFGIEWAMELSSAPSFRMLHDHLKANEPDILAEFERLDASDDIAGDVRFITSSSAGYAFKYWLRGGDLKDLAALFDQGLANSLASLSLAADRLQSHTSEDLQLQQMAEEEIIMEAFKNARIDREAGSKLSALQNALDEFSKRCQANVSTHKIWLLNLEERKALFAKWIESIDEFTLCDSFAEIHRRHQKHEHEKWTRTYEANANLVQRIGTQIVALTATAAARSLGFLQALKPETYIIEEASELTEPITIAALVPSIQHLIKIGDPLQLRPHIGIQALSAENDKRYRLDESLFERMMDKIPYSKLNMQRRAHPELADLLRAGCYPFLVDHPKTSMHSMVPGIRPRMFWLDHDLEEDHPETGSPLAKSFSNTHEAHFIGEAVKYLVKQQGISMKQITILTPYNGQIAQIHSYLKSFCTILLNDNDKASLVTMGLLPPDDIITDPSAAQNVSLDSLIRVATIDNYQGEENDIIFLSTVRSNKQNKAGFLSNQNRINVAISRARNGFFVVGNASLLSQKETGWKQVIDVFRKQNKIGSLLPMLPCAKHEFVTDYKVDVNNPANFLTLPNCQVPCKMLLPCGHHCGEPCHAEEMHTDGRIKCQQPCNKILGCGHRCGNLCHQSCGPCQIPVQPVILQCGHKTPVKCSTDLSTLKCNKLIAAWGGSCGHIRVNLCSTGIVPCGEPCEKSYPCGHLCPNTCSGCPHTGCEQECGRLMDCGHKCRAPCHHGSEDDCPKCSELCDRGCIHSSCNLGCSEICKPCTNEAPASVCPHQEQAVLCSLPGSRIPCSEPCANLAPCGIHQCQGLCGEDCPQVCDVCTGSTKRDNLFVLPCKCIFEVAKLDEQFQLNKIFKMNGIVATGVDITGLPNKECLKCPKCGGSIASSPRYTLSRQLHGHGNLIGNLLSPLGKQIWKFMISVSLAQTELFDNISATSKEIKHGPLTIKNNQETIREALAGIQSVQREVERFQPEIKLVQNAIMSYTGRLVSSKPENIDSILIGIPSLSYLLRSERVLIRCNIITAQFLLDVRSAIRARGQLDDHLKLFLEILLENAKANIEGRAQRLNELIAQCEVMNLKRLQVEFFLQKVSVIILQRRLGQQTAGMTKDFEETSKLCSLHKSTRVLSYLVRKADECIKGNVISLYLDDAALLPPKLSKSPAQEAAAQLPWKRLAIFKADMMIKCPSGHFWSTHHFEHCPECG